MLRKLAISLWKIDHIMPPDNLEMLWLGKMECLKTSYQINIYLKSGSNYDIVTRGVFIGSFIFLEKPIPRRAISFGERRLYLHGCSNA